MDRSTAERLRDRWSQRLEATVGGDVFAAAPPAQLAIGIQGRDEGWRLALRIQRRGAGIDQLIAAIRSDAGGAAEVREVGVVELLAPSPRDPARPLVTGVSCSHAQGGPGTIACFVRRRDDPGSPRFLLSNHHVIGLSGLAVTDDEVLQPARADSAAAGGGVARFERGVKLTTRHNLVDAALARVAGACQVRTVCGIATPIAGVRTTPLVDREPVTKMGRTTGQTHGTIFATGVFNLEVDFNGRPRFFDQQIEIAPLGSGPFCAPGDSGALVLDAQARAVALLFGRSHGPDRLAYANPIAEVLSRLGVELE